MTYEELTRAQLASVSRDLLWRLRLATRPRTPASIDAPTFDPVRPIVTRTRAAGHLGRMLLGDVSR